MAGDSELRRLVERTQAGDREAEGRLAASVEVLARGIVRRRAGHDAYRHVDDVVQETWIRVRRGLPGLKARTNAGVAKWIQTVAWNTFVDVLRGQRERVPFSSLAPWFVEELLAQPPDELELDELDEPDEPDEPNETVEAVLEAWLEKAYAALPDHRKLLLDLAANGVLTWRQIGVELGTTEEGAKSRFRKLKRALAGDLRAYVDRLPRALRDAVRRRGF